MAIKNVRGSRGRTYPKGYTGKKSAGKAVASIDMGKIINQVLLSDSADKKMQKVVYDTVTKNFQETYERYYKQVLREVQRYLNTGFPISSRKNASVRVKVENPMGSDVTFVPNAGKGWEPLTADYLRLKSKMDSEKNAGKWGDKRTKAGKAGMFTHARSPKGAYYEKLAKPVAPSAAGQKFWIFRRNLASAANSALDPNKAKVIFQQKDVTRGGGKGSKVKVTTNQGFSEKQLKHDLRRATADQLTGTQKGMKPMGVVRMNKPVTIHYTAGLKFSTLPTPLNDLVRKPFIQGNSAGVMVWDSGADESRKKGIRVLALVESKRPFIVELSGIMGKLAQKRLKI